MKRGLIGSIIGEALSILRFRSVKKKKSEILIRLNSYDDIFSDFDPRPSSQRSISGDFIAEAKKVVLSNEPERITLHLFTPKRARNLREEIIIRKRLQNHFKTHYYILKNTEIKPLVRQGIIFCSAGILVMLLATIIAHSSELSEFWQQFLIILLEPAGWFLFWEGLYLSILETRKSRINLGFYKKMSNCDIVFSTSKK
ncbi:hypothetical protein HY483_04160 [Candidatus Woesearchaeota archaeon]|nr:hypothetical protein [Candidatus Woesearchaeota archaeon]